MAAGLLASTFVATGCGDSSLEETEVPQLTLHEDTPGSIQLELANSERNPVSQTAVGVRNTGEADMTVNSISWVAHPPRLIGNGDYALDANGDEISCEYDENAGSTLDSSGECPADTFCWPRGSTPRCRMRGFPQTPFTIKPSQFEELDIVLLPGEGEIVCPDAPSGREGLPSDYCGELLIETNAGNDGPSVTEGKLRVFFTYATGSGTIDVNPSSISFAGVPPGQSDNRDLTITNTAEEGTLDVTQVRVQDFANMFTITGPSTAEIEPGSGMDWSIEFNAPSDWDQETFGTDIEILSSGTNERSTLIPITVSSQQDLPAIKLDPQVLRFDESTSQTLTISNEGTASLTMQSFSAGNAYSFSINGTSFDSAVPSAEKVIQAGSSKEVTVDYSAGADEGVGTLEISYVYYIDGNAVPDSASVTLLGELGDAPVGLVAPDRFLFLAESGNSQTRSFVVRNVGTQPLDITAATLSETDGDFSLVGDPTGQIAAGSLQEVTVEYNGSDAQMDNVTLTLDSNTAGDEMSVLLFAQTGAAAGEIDAQITPGFADDTTVVGEEARFSARQSTVAETSILDSATWVLLDRPDGSGVFLEKSGPDVSFFPDVAGDYKIALLITETSGASSQEIYTFTAE
jgi:hypothetical protein